MITLRLNPQLEQQINNTAINLGLTKSELIRQSINEYLCKLQKQNAWEVGEDLFGNYASGIENMAENRKDLMKEKVKTKRK